MRDTENREVLRVFLALYGMTTRHLLTGTEGGVLAAGNGGLSVIEAGGIERSSALCLSVY